MRMQGTTGVREQAMSQERILSKDTAREESHHGRDYGGTHSVTCDRVRNHSFHATRKTGAAERERMRPCGFPLLSCAWPFFSWWPILPKPKSPNSFSTPTEISSCKRRRR